MKQVFLLISLLCCFTGGYCQLYTMTMQESYKEQEKILKKFTHLAEKGDTAAINQLGMLYYQNKYGNAWLHSNSYDKALYWFLKGDALNCVQCSFGAGVVYKNGPLYIRSTDTSYYNRDSAIYFLNKAADKGYAPACYEMGLAWLSTRFYNLANARLWFDVAAKNGYKLAITRLEDMAYANINPLEKGDNALVNGDYKMAYRLWKIAADYNHDKVAMVKIAMLGMTDQHSAIYGDWEWFQVSTDDSPLGWLMKSDELGYLEATYQLGKMYQLLGDKDKALENYNKAAQRGHPLAAGRLKNLQATIDQEKERQDYLYSLRTNTLQTRTKDAKICSVCGGKGYTNDHVTYYGGRSDGKGGTMYGEGGVKSCGTCGGKGYVVN